VETPEGSEDEWDPGEVQITINLLYPGVQYGI